MIVCNGIARAVDYYRATVQLGETDPDKLHDLKNDLDARQVYSWQQVEDLAALYLKGADRDQLDPILDACVAGCRRRRRLRRERRREQCQISGAQQAQAIPRRAPRPQA